MVELLAGCSGYAMAVGPAMAFSAVAANAFAAVEPSAALIGQLVSDYFGHTCRDRPQDFWECGRPAVADDSRK
jgi:hypothetical protein